MLLVVLIGMAITASLAMMASSIDTTYQNAAECVSTTALGPTPGGPGSGLGGGTGAPGQGQGKGGGKGKGNSGSGQSGCP